LVHARDIPGVMNAAEQQAMDRYRELNHAMWRVSALEHLLKMHRRRQCRDEEWKHEEANIELRLKTACSELSRLSRLHDAARIDLAA
jgi:hypothetical protein